MGTFLEILNVAWVTIGLILCVIVFTEFGVDAIRNRIRKMRYGDKGKVVYSALADAYRDEDWADDFFHEYQNLKSRWAPYVHWWAKPYRGRLITVDEKGLRHTWQPPAGSAGGGKRRLYFFGGSTIFGTGARDDWTIPSLLAKRLSENGMDVEMVNFGQPGHASTQGIITFFEQLKTRPIPDLALFYDGLNEIIHAEATGRVGGLFKEDNRRQEFNLLSDERRKDLVREAIATLTPRTRRRLRGLGKILGLAQGQDMDYIRFTRQDIPKLSNDIMEYYAENVRNIRAVARNRGITVRFVLQPSLFGKKSMTDHEAGHLFDAAPAPELRIPLFEAAYDAWRRNPLLSGNADTIDLGALFDDREEGIFCDPFHLVEGGNETVADMLFPHVVEALENPVEPASS